MVVIGKNTKRNFSTTQAKYILLIIKLYFCPYLLSSFSHILSLFPKQTHLWACVLQIINTFLPIATVLQRFLPTFSIKQFAIYPQFYSHYWGVSFLIGSYAAKQYFLPQISYFWHSKQAKDSLLKHIYSYSENLIYRENF